MTLDSHSLSSESGSVAGDFPFDWSHFEPNSVQIYDESGSDWTMGRAQWKPSCTLALTAALPGSPEEGPAHPDSVLPLRGTVLQRLYDDELGSDRDSGVLTSKDEKRSSSYFPVKTLTQSTLPFKSIERPLHPHVLPLPPPETDDITRQIAFFIARADDPEGQARLRLECQGMAVMYAAGLPVLPKEATWTDKYGNLVAILHLSPQGITTLREMYVQPFKGDRGRGKGGTAGTLGQAGVVGVLDQLLSHCIQMVSAIEVHLFFRIPQLH